MQLHPHHVNTKEIDVTVLIETAHLKQCVNRRQSSLLKRTSDIYVEWLSKVIWVHFNVSDQIHIYRRMNHSREGLTWKFLKLCYNFVYVASAVWTLVKWNTDILKRLNGSLELLLWKVYSRFNLLRTKFLKYFCAHGSSTNIAISYAHDDPPLAPLILCS